MAWDAHTLALDVVEEFAVAGTHAPTELPSYHDAIRREVIYNRNERREGMASVGVEWWQKLIRDTIQRRNTRVGYERSARGKQAAEKQAAYRLIKNDPAKLDVYRARKREEARKRRRASRTACDFVQLNLPHMEQNTMREKLPRDRVGVTQKFTIITRQLNGDGQATVEEIDIYLTANVYPADYKNEARRGQLGEVFIRMGKAGGTEGIFDEWAKATSRALQHGVPVDDQFRQHIATCFAPFGATTSKEFPSCTSVLDLVSRWILSRFGSAEAKQWIASMRREEAA